MMPMFVGAIHGCPSKGVIVRMLTSVLAAALVFSCARLSAQFRTIETGTRARVAYECSARTLYGGRTLYDCLTATGRLATLSVDSIVLTADFSHTQLTVPFRSMAMFEVNRGERSQQLLGAGLGIIAGGGLGLAWAGLKCEGAYEPCAPTEYLLLSALLAAPAAAIGAYLGNVWIDRWERVPIGWLRASALRQPSGFALGAEVTF